eukprot:2013678-Rhodomonas_salina.6
MQQALALTQTTLDEFGVVSSLYPNGEYAWVDLESGRAFPCEYCWDYIVPHTQLPDQEGQDVHSSRQARHVWARVTTSTGTGSACAAAVGSQSVRPSRQTTVLQRSVNLDRSLGRSKKEFGGRYKQKKSSIKIATSGNQKGFLSPLPGYRISVFGFISARSSPHHRERSPHPLPLQSAGSNEARGLPAAVSLRQSAWRGCTVSAQQLEVELAMLDLVA